MSRQLVFVLLLFNINVFAQNQGDLSGRVIDSETGFGLEGAAIQIESSDFYSVTDQNGYFQFYNVKPEIMEIRVVISGYQSVERTLRAENGLIAPFTMVEGNSSSIIQENTVGSEGGWSLEAAVALSTFLGIVTIITGFVGIQASVEIRRGKK